MYKVILADDEKKILDGLASLIDWEELHLIISGRVNNGEEALEIIRSCRPQILITDIKMPVLDGIDLIRRVRELYPEIHCLVLSGYDDYPLVREAMRCGAENYLLKPVDREELVQNLKEIVITLEAEDSQIFPRWSGHRLLLNNLMNRIVRNDISHKEFRRKMEFLQVDIYDSAFVMTVFACPVLQPGSAGNDIEVYEQLADLLEKNHRGIVFRDLAGHPAALFFIDDQKDLPEMEDQICQFLMEKGQSWIAVSGDVVSSYRDLHLSYSQALKGVSMNRLLPLDCFCSYRSLLLEAEKIHQTVQPALEQLQQIFHNTSAEPSVPRILSSLPEEFRDSRSMRFFCGTLLANMLKVFSGSSIPDLLEEDVLSILKPVLSHFEKDEWEAGLTALIKSVEKLRGLRQNSVHSPLVEKLVSQVEDNYQDFNISLKILAADMNVSPEHAGRMFKKEIGRFFSDFLSEVRIRHACEMLRGTSLPANDIALKVGFLNQNYFYTKFKKYTGQNPTRYRSLREKESLSISGFPMVSFF